MQIDCRWWPKAGVGLGVLLLVVGCIGDPSLIPPPGDECAECAIDVRTLEPFEIEATRAKLKGEWSSEEVRTVEGRGGCGARTEEALMAGDGICVSVGSGEPGEFTIEVASLTPGTRYYFRAYIEVDGERQYGEVKSAVTLAPAVEITASRDQLGEVVVSWEAAQGALSYRVLRDGELYATEDGGLVCMDSGDCRFEDAAVDAPDPEPGPPVNVVASEGDHIDKVVVTWEAPDAEVESYLYQVVAIYADAESEESNQAEGSSSGFQISRYEIERVPVSAVEEEPGEASLLGEVTAGSELRWEDFTASPAEIEVDPDLIRVGQGDSEDGVPLSVEGTTVKPASEYRYRVTLIAGDGQRYLSDERPKGYRGGTSEDLIFEWERRDETDDASGAEEAGVGSAVFDENAEESGAGHYYRLAVSLEGTTDTEVISERFWGFRAVPLSFYTVGADGEMHAWTGNFGPAGVYDGEPGKTKAALGSGGDVYVGSNGGVLAQMGRVRRLDFSGTIYQSTWDFQPGPQYFGVAWDRRVTVLEVVGDIVVAGYLTGDLFFLNRESGEEIGSFELQSGATAMVAPDPSSVYVGTASGEVVGIDLGSFLQTSSYVSFDDSDGVEVRGLSVTRNPGEIVMGMADGKVWIVDMLDSGGPVATLLFEADVPVLDVVATAEDAIYVLTETELRRVSGDGTQPDWTTPLNAIGTAVSLAVDPYGRSIVGFRNGEVARFSRTGSLRDQAAVISTGLIRRVYGVAVERGSKAVFGDAWDPYTEPASGGSQ